MRQNKFLVFNYFAAAIFPSAVLIFCFQVNSVFIVLFFFEPEEDKIYSCFGMGQTHFVFTHKEIMIRIPAGTISANDFLKEYIRLVN